MGTTNSKGEVFYNGEMCSNGKGWKYGMYQGARDLHDPVYVFLNVGDDGTVSVRLVPYDLSWKGQVMMAQREKEVGEWREEGVGKGGVVRFGDDPREEKAVYLGLFDEGGAVKVGTRVTKTLEEIMEERRRMDENVEFLEGGDCLTYEIGKETRLKTD